MSHIIAQVAKGVELLDTVRPNWLDLVNLDELNMESTSNCVLGQVFRFDESDGMFDSGYHRGLRILNYETGTPTESLRYEHGFSLPSMAPAGEWHVLTAEWTRVINERRSAGWQPMSTRTETVENAETISVTREQLVALVTRAMDSAPTRGAYSEIGLTFTFLNENNLL